MVNYIFRALPLSRDSRTERYRKWLNGNVVINTWEDSFTQVSGIEKLKIGRAKCSKVISYPLYLIYLFIYSLLNVKKDDRIICMELDTFIPVILGSFWKGSTIYFDIVDPIGQTKFRRMPLNKFFDYIEFFCLRFRKFNIVPNVNRIDYYKQRLGLDVTKCKYLLVENVPLLENTFLSKNSNVCFYDIGYFGTLDDSRGLIELIDFSRVSGLKLLIAGSGPLEEYISKKSIEFGDSNLYYFGKYSSNQLESLYKMVRFSWAYYTHKTMLHKFASPNKYYEHLAFKTPLIMNSFVPLSQIIKLNKTGIVIDDVLEKINFEKMYDELKCFNVGDSDFSEWELHYENYKVDFLNYEVDSLI